jgi:hypothetical protein
VLERARESRPLERGAKGIIAGFAIIGMILVLAFAILAGYSVGKDLQSRGNAPDKALNRSNPA